jgi:hypothetical protein
MIDHGYGYVLYTTTLTTGGATLAAPNIRDYGYVFLNNNYQVKLAYHLFFGFFVHFFHRKMFVKSSKNSNFREKTHPVNRKLTSVND